MDEIANVLGRFNEDFQKFSSYLSGEDRGKYVNSTNALRNERKSSIEVGGENISKRHQSESKEI